MSDFNPTFPSSEYNSPLDQFKSESADKLKTNKETIKDNKAKITSLNQKLSRKNFAIDSIGSTITNKSEMVKVFDKKLEKTKFYQINKKSAYKIQQKILTSNINQLSTDWRTAAVEASKASKKIQTFESESQMLKTESKLIKEELPQIEQIVERKLNMLESQLKEVEDLCAKTATSSSTSANKLYHDYEGAFIRCQDLTSQHIDLAIKYSSKKIEVQVTVNQEKNLSSQINHLEGQKVGFNINLTNNKNFLTTEIKSDARRITKQKIKNIEKNIEEVTTKITILRLY
ncbi:MAG: hypothetical protein Q8K75_03605 [Chlamydiales bacterium]|nr:hypothetical protein [Chlamydiales bacterium]